MTANDRSSIYIIIIFSGEMGWKKCLEADIGFGSPIC